MSIDINLTPTASYVGIPRRSNPVNGGNETATTIPARTWGLASDCRAAALLVHGLGAHSGWYEALGRRLKVRGIFSLAYDQVGFGKRSGEVLMMKQQWLDDLKDSYDYLRQTVGDKPIFIIGNSMGALVALRSMSTTNPSGLVMFSPGFDGHPDTFTLSYKAKTLLTALIKPDSQVKLPYTTDQITREPMVRGWLNNDADSSLVLPARTMLELLKLTEETKNTGKKLPSPLFMFTAGQEKIVNNEVSETIFAKLVAPRKQKHHFPEAWHDLMFDPVLDELVDMLAAWMLEIGREKLQVS
ncbi:MAG: alpha/beta fold hydrolase [Cyanobacteria bacterium SZAS LIN-2]|nr:alpha/beta fold hydrolase [Cyanobacteria bacterium SZAS LIN-3]MBS1996577.1 alpha/beta fold hydrolase [Cyanobacteria bacterium SZAS LIN-2]MBS2006559.1 alpha/beta fold hydrolase [Cyanobacteria bacterium SZAS TMP-1]